MTEPTNTPAGSAGPTGPLSDATKDAAATPASNASAATDKGIDEIREKAEELFALVKEKAGPIFNDLKAKVEPVLADLKEKAQPYVDQAKEKAQPLIDDVSGKIDELRGKSDAKPDAGGLVDATSESTEENLAEKPATPLDAGGSSPATTENAPGVATPKPDVP